MLFGVDQFYGGTSSGVFAGFASVMVIQSFCKAFGYAGIQRLVVAL